MVGVSRGAAFLGCVLTATTAAVFFLSLVVAWPMPVYLPLERRWTWAAGSESQELLSTVAMDYYGRSWSALCAAFLVTFAVWFVGRIRRNAPTSPASFPSQRTLFLAASYAVTAVVFCVSLMAYKLIGREPTSPGLFGLFGLSGVPSFGDCPQVQPR
mgnify:CR=1 FL=1